MSDNPYDRRTLGVMLCMALLSEDMNNVDLEELDDLVQCKFGLTPEQADEWFAVAADEGAIELAPDRSTH